VCPASNAKGSASLPVAGKPGGSRKPTFACIASERAAAQGQTLNQAMGDVCESRHRVAVGGDTLAQKFLVDQGIWGEGDDPKAIAERVAADSRGTFEAELAVRVARAR
jgi:hypothetical protein